jgi:hypothetical protein
MALFSAAAAAAIERPAEGSTPGIYSYPTELEFNVKSNGRFAPSIVVKILAQLLLDEPDVVFTDSKGHRIMVEDFPKAKIEFDDVFCTTTAGGRLSCKFEIRSSRHSFHAVKIGGIFYRRTRYGSRKRPDQSRRRPSPPSVFG